MIEKITLEKHAVEEYTRLFTSGKEGRGQRLGQYLHDKFKMDQMSDGLMAEQLYQLDGRSALNFIRDNFELS